MGRRQSRTWIVVLLLLAVSAATLLSVGGTELLLSVLRTAGVILAALVPLFYVLVVVLLLSALPHEPELTPLLGESLPDDMAAIDRQFLEAGFRRVGGMSMFNTKPKTRMVNYIHEERGAYGTLQKLWRNPPAFGLITPREDGAGHVETVANAEIDGLPAPPGVARQVIEDAAVEDLARHHGEGLELLAADGTEFLPVHETELESQLFLTVLRQRQLIYDRPFYCGGAMLWRTLTGSYPNLGPLRERRPPAP